MEALTYKLEMFEGPLDLLLTLIDKNKVNISDIPIALICDQYMEYISEVKNLDMEIAAEFIVMASELMLIKSKMLLPKINDEEEDPRAALADALLRYKQAKEAAEKMLPLYAEFSGRMIKDTDEISIDKTEVDDQDITKLFEAMKHIIMQNSVIEKAEKTHFTPLIQKPIVSVELKIIEILEVLNRDGKSSLLSLLSNSSSRSDLIASFMGILELIKVRRILIEENGTENEDSIHGTETVLYLNPNSDTSESAEISTYPDDIKD
ncbi:MAG: segregation/condensation protein A [Clostridia bacterium]|nr:segregation/condensation protein A [Clostridia bacterium]